MRLHDHLMMEGVYGFLKEGPQFGLQARVDVQFRLLDQDRGWPFIQACNKNG
jgi:hypothetical protein